jgi:arginyl-tRNA--protein-N-Asp/Glu arginylyltransferase
MDDMKVMEAGPQGFKGAYLDKLLEKGYFRDGRKMVAKDLEQDHNHGDRPKYNWVCMLRYPVADCKPSASILNIRNLCAGFALRQSTLTVTPELEQLYCRYCESVDIELPGSLKVQLQGGEASNPFDTSVIEVRDGGRLIAAGFLDRGSESIMGVLDIHDPDYDRYSLAEFLIDRKIETARSEGLSYFYPGCIMILNDRLDYKLSFDREQVQVYLSADEVWEPFKKHDKESLERFLLMKHFDLDLDDLFPDEAGGPWD